LHSVNFYLTNIVLYKLLTVL